MANWLTKTERQGQACIVAYLGSVHLLKPKSEVASILGRTPFYAC